MIYRICFFLLLSVNHIIAQNDSLNIESLDGYLKSTIGMSVGDLNGNVSEFTTGVIGVDISVGKEFNNNIWDVNINFLTGFIEKFFTFSVIS